MSGIGIGGLRAGMGGWVWVWVFCCRGLEGRLVRFWAGWGLGLGVEVRDPPGENKGHIEFLKLLWEGGEGVRAGAGLGARAGDVAIL